VNPVALVCNGTSLFGQSGIDLKTEQKKNDFVTSGLRVLRAASRELRVILLV
jgi:hypothetical protein